MYKVVINSGYDKVPIEFEDFEDVIMLCRDCIDNIVGENPHISIYPAEETKENPG